MNGKRIFSKNRTLLGYYRLRAQLLSLGIWQAELFPVRPRLTLSGGMGRRKGRGTSL